MHVYDNASKWLIISKVKELRSGFLVIQKFGLLCHWNMLKLSLTTALLINRLDVIPGLCLPSMYVYDDSLPSQYWLDPIWHTEPIFISILYSSFHFGRTIPSFYQSLSEPRCWSFLCFFAATLRLQYAINQSLFPTCDERDRQPFTDVSMELELLYVVRMINNINSIPYRTKTDSV